MTRESPARPPVWARILRQPRPATTGAGGAVAGRRSARARGGFRSALIGDSARVGPQPLRRAGPCLLCGAAGLQRYGEIVLDALRLEHVEERTQRCRVFLGLFTRPLGASAVVDRMLRC